MRSRRLLRNMAPILISLAIFVAAFLVLSMVGRARQPKTIAVLALQHDMQMGDTLTAADVYTVSLPVAGNVAAFVRADEIDQVEGGVVLFPLLKDQLLPRAAVAAAASEELRLSALLAGDPNAMLFSLPLDASNVVAPPLETFHSGDRVDVIAVIGRNSVANTSPFTTPGEGMQEDIQRLLKGLPIPGDVEDTDAYTATLVSELTRARPPVAKSLFPRGLPVIRVVGGRRTYMTQEGDAVVPISTDIPPALILRVSAQEHEKLAWALAAADRVFVTLVPPTFQVTSPGFSRDDFLAGILADRLQTLIERSIEASPTITPTATITMTTPVTVTPPITVTPTPTATPAPTSWLLSDEDLAALLILWSQTTGASATVRQDPAGLLASEYPSVATTMARLAGTPQSLEERLANLNQRGLLEKGEDSYTLIPPIDQCLLALANAQATCTVERNEGAGGFTMTYQPRQEE